MDKMRTRGEEKRRDRERSGDGGISYIKKRYRKYVLASG